MTSASATRLAPTLKRGCAKAAQPLNSTLECTIMPAWTYLLLSSRGEVYLGATTHLRKRLRHHNSPENTGWTKGRRWHLLAVRIFETRAAAFGHESEMKKMPHKKIIWKLQCIERASLLVARYRYPFCPESWPSMHHPAYVKKALEQVRSNHERTSSGLQPLVAAHVKR